LDKPVMTLAPPQRGVAVAEFTVSRPHFFRGIMLVEERGKRVVPQYGQVRVSTEEGEAISPLGEHGEFDLMGVPFGKQRLFVDYTEGTCILDMVMPDTGQTVIDLGELVCVTN
jgi:outer membrane usher protein